MREPLVLLGFPLEGPITRHPLASWAVAMAIFTTPLWARLALLVWDYFWSAQ